MTIDINVHHHHHFPPAQPDPRLDQIVALLHALKQQGARLMATVADLTNAVAAEKSVEDSAIVLIQGLAKQIADAQGSSDPAAMDALLAQIQAQSAALASAVSAVPTPAPAAPTPAPAADPSASPPA